MILSFDTNERWREYLDNFTFEGIGFVVESESGGKITYRKKREGSVDFEVIVYPNENSATIYTMDEGGKHKNGSYTISDHCELIYMLYKHFYLIELDDPDLQKYKQEIGCNFDNLKR